MSLMSSTSSSSSPSLLFYILFLPFAYNNSMVNFPMLNNMQAASIGDYASVFKHVKSIIRRETLVADRSKWGALCYSEIVQGVKYQQSPDFICKQKGSLFHQCNILTSYICHSCGYVWQSGQFGLFTQPQQMLSLRFMSLTAHRISAATQFFTQLLITFLWVAREATS